MRLFWIVLATLLFYTGVQAQTLLPDLPPFVAWGMMVVLFGLMLGWQFLYRAHAVAIESEWFFWLAWCGSIAFGWWATFVLLSLPVNLAGLLYWLVRNDWPGSIQHGLIASFWISLFIAALGMRQAMRGPVLKQVTIPCENLAADLDGLTIVQISDLHVGPTIRQRYVDKVVRQVGAVAADMIVITGDMADGHADHLAQYVAPLGQLRAPLGVYFITGNHEYYWNALQWIDKAIELGFIPLLNSNRIVRRGAGRILVAGITDASGGQFIPAHRSDPRLAGTTEEIADFRLLLAHRPGGFAEAEAAGFDLQLSGHTHGGQFFPFNLLVRMAHRYHSGLFRHGAMWLYVSPGTGYWGMPNRFWIPSEITLLRLAKTA